VALAGTKPRHNRAANNGRQNPSFFCTIRIVAKTSHQGKAEPACFSRDALQRRTGCVRVMKNQAGQRFLPPDEKKIKRIIK
jgi:hypothetical protein